MNHLSKEGRGFWGERLLITPSYASYSDRLLQRIANRSRWWVYDVVAAKCWTQPLRTWVGI